MSYVEYESNNSGGEWWLDDADWAKLEEAGWVVAWLRLRHVYDTNGGYSRDERGLPLLEPIPEGEKELFVRRNEAGEYRMLGALAKTAYLPNCRSLHEAAENWERVTGKSATDAGCPCCGQPHTFTLYDDAGKHVTSGPHTSYEASW